MVEFSKELAVTHPIVSLKNEETVSLKNASSLSSELERGISHILLLSYVIMKVNNKEKKKKLLRNAEYFKREIHFCT
jgi:hypothetical protein